MTHCRSITVGGRAPRARRHSRVSWCAAWHKRRDEATAGQGREREQGVETRPAADLGGSRSAGCSSAVGKRSRRRGWMVPEPAERPSAGAENRAWTVGDRTSGAAGRGWCGAIGLASSGCQPYEQGDANLVSGFSSAFLDAPGFRLYRKSSPQSCLQGLGGRSPVVGSHPALGQAEGTTSFRGKAKTLMDDVHGRPKAKNCRTQRVGSAHRIAA